MLICVGIVGIICIVLGIKIAMRINEKIKRGCKAVVIYCEECDKNNDESYLQNYNVYLEIESGVGPVRQLIESDNYCLPGAEFQVYSDRLNDEFEFISELKTKRSNALIAGIGSGMMFFAVIAFIYIGSQKCVGQEIWGGVITYLVGLGMSAVGLFKIIKLIVAHKNKDAYKVNGKIVDFVMNGHDWRSYLRIYEFYDNGVRRTMKATIDGVKRGRVGDDVVIVIDRQTGKAYCEMDYKQHIFLNAFVVICGLVFLYGAFVITVFG